MGWPRGTSGDGRPGRIGRVLRSARLWAPIWWAPIWLALACNGEAVAPPRIFVPGEDTLGPRAPCIGPYCRESLLGIYDMHEFYRKIIVTNQVAIVGSHQVQDRALELAVEVVEEMIAARIDIWPLLVEAEAFVAVMAGNEVTTDIPEHRFLQDDPDIDWNTRARGLAATPENPITTIGEENLLCGESDRYAGESILVHEFAHSLHALAINIIDPGFDAELDSLFLLARAEGLWVDTFAHISRQEYWAEGVQSWFNANQGPQDGIHNHVDTRDELLEYDPRLHEVISRYFAATDWSPSCPSS